MTTAAYSILVVTWECERYLRSLIDSMNNHLEGTEELVVVDNASTDDPRATAQRWRGPLLFEQLEENVGFGAANNAGVALATRPVVVMINPDTEVLEGGLAALAAAALESGGLVGPRVLWPDGSIQPSASGPEVGPWAWVRAFCPGALAPRPIAARTEPYRLTRPTPVTWLTGSCIAGPRDVLLRLGPFDPSLHMYGEDIDLGLRADAQGIPRWFRPDACAIVHHAGGSSTKLYGSLHGWRPEGTRNWRAALERAYGRRRAWLAWRALRINLSLRYWTKRALGRVDEPNRAALMAARAATSYPALQRSAEPAGQRAR